MLFTKQFCNNLYVKHIALEKQAVCGPWCSAALVLFLVLNSYLLYFTIWCHCRILHIYMVFNLYSPCTVPISSPQGIIKYNLTFEERSNSFGSLLLKTGNISLDLDLWTKVKLDINIGFFTYIYIAHISCYRWYRTHNVQVDFDSSYRVSFWWSVHFECLSSSHKLLQVM